MSRPNSELLPPELSAAYKNAPPRKPSRFWPDVWRAMFILGAIAGVIGILSTFGQYTDESIVGAIRLYGAAIGFALSLIGLVLCRIADALTARS